ncbi:MAG: hypothetical protein V4668_03765 [Patescibacteria group bacterium]
MESFLKSVSELKFSTAYVVGGVIIAIIIVWLIFSRSRRSADYFAEQTVVKRPDLKPFPKALKDYYTEQVASAVLIRGGTKEIVEYHDLVEVMREEEYYAVTLTSEEKEILLRLGASDLLVCTGKPEECDFSSSHQVSFWSLGEMVYKTDLADFQLSEGKVTGYDRYGCDVLIVMGSALMMSCE